MKNNTSPKDRLLSLPEILSLKDVVFRYEVDGNPHYQYTTSYDTRVMGYPTQRVSYCPVAELGQDLMLAPWRWLTKSDSESKSVMLTYVYDAGNPSKGCYALIREPAEGGPYFDVTGKAWNFRAHTLHLKMDEFGAVLTPRPVMAYRASTQKWVLCRHVGCDTENNLPFVMENADGTRWYSAYFREIGTCLPAIGQVSDDGRIYAAAATITDYSPNSTSPFATDGIRWKYANLEVDDDVIDRKGRAQPNTTDLPMVAVSYVSDDRKEWVRTALVHSVKDGAYLDRSGKAWKYTNGNNAELWPGGEVSHPRHVLARKSGEAGWQVGTLYHVYAKSHAPFGIRDAQGNTYIATHIREMADAMPKVLPRKAYVRTDENSIWVTRRLVESAEGRHVTSDGKTWPHMAEMDSNPFPRMMRVSTDGKEYIERIVDTHDTEQGLYRTFMGCCFRFAEDIEAPDAVPPVECTYMGVDYTFPREQSPGKENQERNAFPRPAYVRNEESHGWKLRMLTSDYRNRYRTTHGCYWKYMKEVYEITKDDVISVA